MSNGNRELKTPAEVDALIAELEPLIVRTQMKAAVNRLLDHFEKELAKDIANGRRVVEMTHLLTGNRRVANRGVELERRRDYDGS